MFTSDTSCLPNEPVQVAHFVGHSALPCSTCDTTNARTVVALKLIRWEIVKGCLFRRMPVGQRAVNADHRGNVAATIDVIDELELVREVISREFDHATFKIAIVTAHIPVDMSFHEVN